MLQTPLAIVEYLRGRTTSNIGYATKEFRGQMPDGSSCWLRVTVTLKLFPEDYKVRPEPLLQLALDPPEELGRRFEVREGFRGGPGEWREVDEVGFEFYKRACGLEWRG